MATLSVSLLSDISPSDIDNVDILINKKADPSVSQYRILTDFPDYLNLRDGVVLNKFGKIEKGADQILVVRIFLKRAPYVAHSTSLVFIDHDHQEAFFRIDA